MGVDLGGHQALVAQQFLDATDIGAAPDLVDTVVQPNLCGKMGRLYCGKEAFNELTGPIAFVYVLP